jgi:hypothetical protein
LKEGGDALKTLLSSVAERRLNALMAERPPAVEALARLRPAFTDDSFIKRVRDSIGSHYRHADIKRVFESDLAKGRVDGAVIACEIGGLSRFTITDVLALHLLDEAAGADLALEKFAKRGKEVVALADDLSTFVGHIVDALLQEHGVEVTHDVIEVPTLLRAAYDSAEASERRPGN